MDPLSLAASIAGLLSLAGAVISAGYKLSAKLDSDTDDTKTLVTETANFSGILLGVKSHLDSSRPGLIDLEALANIIRDSELTLKEIDQLLRKLSTSNRLAMLFKAGGREEQAVKLIRWIEQYKLFFILCFQFDHRKVLKDLLASWWIVDRASEHQEKVIRWLGTTTEAEHDDLCQQRDEASAEWILNREEFGAWLSSPASSFLWLNGTQGSGKSVIVSKIIRVIQETILEPGISALAYHYCRFSNSSSLSPYSLVGSIIGQLLKQSSDPSILMGPLNKLYDKYHKRSAHPSFEDLQNLFVELSQYFGRIFK
ncbi:hypothetical protein F66182_2728 [Fusarium sp. NRRL 66182]|nr:hypothetical protein F66182_2728 [Fusarium sp. NRRL 66182]